MPQVNTQTEIVEGLVPQGSQVDQDSAASVAEYINAYNDYVNEVQAAAVVVEPFSMPEHYLFGVDSSVFQGLADVEEYAQIELEALWEAAETDEDLKAYLDSALETYVRGNNPNATEDAVSKWVATRDYRGAANVTALQTLKDLTLGIREALSLKEKVAETPQTQVTAQESRIRELLDKDKLSGLEKFEAAFGGYKRAVSLAEEGMVVDPYTGTMLKGSMDPSAMSFLGGSPKVTASQEDINKNLKDTQIPEALFSKLDTLVGNAQERAGFLEQKQIMYQNYVQSAVDAVFQDTGLSGLGTSKLEMYYGRGLPGLDRNDPAHLEELKGMGTWGWRDLAVQQLYEQGKQAVEEGIYGQVITLPTAMIRQFLDISMDNVEAQAAIGPRGLMDVLSQIKFEGLETANNLTAYTMERMGNAYANRLADVANRSGTDLLGLYNSGQITADERVAQYAQKQTSLQKDLGIEPMNPMAEWDEVMFNFKANVEQAFFGGVGALGNTAVIPSGEAHRKGSTSLSYAPAGTKEGNWGESMVPAIQGFFGPQGAGQADLAYGERMVPKKEGDEDKTQPRRLQFPSWRYQRRRY